MLWFKTKAEKREKLDRLIERYERLLQGRTSIHVEDSRLTRDEVQSRLQEARDKRAKLG